MSAGNRKHPARLAPSPSRNATPTARIVADLLMMLWLGVFLTVLAAAYFGVI